MHEGQCLCAKVVFEVSGDLTDASLCHCSICRKATGSAFAAYVGVQCDEFKWLQGEALVKKFEVTEWLSKFFCSACGSTLVTHHRSDPDMLYLSLGSLKDDPPIDLEYHQFVGSKASWHQIHDSLPQYEEWPPDVDS